MKNIHHQTSVVVIPLMTYIHVKLTLFICCLFRLYIKHVENKYVIKEKSFLKDKKKTK